MADKPKKGGDEDGDDQIKEKFVAKNWGFFKKDERALRKMAPQQRSKYMAYEEPPKEISEAKAATMKRLLDKKKNIKSNAGQEANDDEVVEKDNHDRLIGQLKAAEARNRIRIMRLRYEANRSQEVNHLIACQSTARKAVRLQALVPARLEDRSGGDKLDKISRARVELLLDDSRGLLTGRT